MRGRAYLVCLAFGMSYFCASGCVYVSDYPNVDVKLPDEALGVSFITDTEVMKRNMDDIIGSIYEQDAQGKYHEMWHITPDPKPVLTQIPAADNVFYHSVITKSMGGKGSYLGELTVECSDETTESVTITESAYMSIPWQDVPTTKIVDWLQQHPAQPGCRYLYVQILLLSNVSYTVYSKTSSGATVTGAVGVNGNVYATTGADMEQNRVVIGAHLLDITSWGENRPKPTPAPLFSLKGALSSDNYKILPVIISKIEKSPSN